VSNTAGAGNAVIDTRALSSEDAKGKRQTIHPFIQGFTIGSRGEGSNVATANNVVYIGNAKHESHFQISFRTSANRFLATWRADKT
jgi:hypothetical protein